MGLRWVLHTATCLFLLSALFWGQAHVSGLSQLISNLRLVPSCDLSTAVGLGRSAQSWWGQLLLGQEWKETGCREEGKNGAECFKHRGSVCDSLEKDSSGEPRQKPCGHELLWGAVLSIPGTRKCLQEINQRLSSAWQNPSRGIVVSAPRVFRGPRRGDSGDCHWPCGRI